MKRFSALAVLLVLSAAQFGCKVEEDQTKREGFVDTSNPSDVMKTMTPPPGGGGAPATGGPGAPGPGPAPAGS